MPPGRALAPALRSSAWPLATVAALIVLVPAGAVASEGVWLGLDTPGPEAVHRGPSHLFEVRGRAGAGSSDRRDVVIVLDVSGSTLVSSGVDVDGDGVVGETSRKVRQFLTGLRPWGTYRLDEWSSDLDDSIRQAEIAAAERLLDLLDPERTRVGIVSFDNYAEIEAPVGSEPEKLREALARIGRDPTAYGGATNFEKAIRTALRALRTDRGGGSVEPAILFLSDGQPTAPGGLQRASRRALGAARRAAKRGVPIHTFALGQEALSHYGIFAEMAEVTGGRLSRVARPGEIVSQLARVDLAEIARISITNLTSGDGARALRVFPDGSFDGYIPLIPGENRLSVIAYFQNGHQTRLERGVRYVVPEPGTEQERRQHRLELERFTRELRDRSTETGLVEAIRAAQEDDGGPQDKEVAVELDRRE